MKAPREYDIGDLVRASATFKNAGNAAIDPTTVSFKVKNPAGTVTTYVYPTDAALVKDSTGNYHVDINANAVGFWYYRFFATGSGQSAAEAIFRVKNSNF